MNEDLKRRHPLNKEEMEALAQILAEKILCKHDCQLTQEEIGGVKSMLGVRKSSLKLLIWFAAVMAALAVKDLYTIIVSHLHWVGVKQ